jgi:hypothetical protein
MAEMDFPPSPTVGQKYVNSAGVVYDWNGFAWVIGFVDIVDQSFGTIGDILEQIRIYLQDTEVTAAGYRYSDASIVANINMGMWEMYRIRPDIFLEVNYDVPQFDAAELDADWPIEKQWIPSIVFYAVGTTQLRDDEGTQDARAVAFMQKFTATLVPAP